MQSEYTRVVHYATSTMTYMNCCLYIIHLSCTCQVAADRLPGWSRSLVGTAAAGRCAVQRHLVLGCVGDREDVRSWG